MLYDSQDLDHVLEVLNARSCRYASVEKVLEN